MIVSIYMCPPPTKKNDGEIAFYHRHYLKIFKSKIVIKGFPTVLKKSDVL